MTQEHTSTPPVIKPPVNRSFRHLVIGVVRHAERALFWASLLCALLYLILQMPLVQNGLTGWASRLLSKELNNTVALRHIDVQFFDNLLLEGLYISDQSGDTLVYLDRLSAGLQGNIFSLFNDRLEFNELSVSGLRLYLRRPEYQRDFTLQFLLDYLGGGEASSGPARPFLLRIQRLQLRDIIFEKNDRSAGERLYAYLNNSLIRLDQFQVKEQQVNLRSVAIDGLWFEVQHYASKPDTSAAVAPLPQPVADTLPADTLWFDIARIQLNNGHFRFDKFDRSPARTTPDSIMDFDHLKVDKIALRAESVRFNNQLQFEGVLKHLGASEQCGFVLQHAEAQRVVVNDTITALYGLDLQTPESRLGDTLMLHYFEYGDYNRFVDMVYMDLRLKPESALLLKDVSHFGSALASNPFFRQNLNKKAELHGGLNGSVNRLNGRKMTIGLGQAARFEGDFDLDDLVTSIDKLRLRFDCKPLQSDMSTLRSILPGFTAPQQFDELGSFSFTGTYQLLFGYNHLLNGKLNSQVGRGNLDMELDLTKGADKATYSGRLNLFDFNLAAWTGNPDFGKSAFRISIAEGSSGLRLASMKTTFDGHIDTLFFRNYLYHDIDVDLTVNGFDFEGKVNVNDPNFNLTVDGQANLKDSVKTLDIGGEIRRIDLCALNLIDKDWVLSGTIDQIALRGSSIDNGSGIARLCDLTLWQDSSYIHTVDSIFFESRYLPADGSRRYYLLSDPIDGHLTGQFALSSLVSNLSAMFASYYPKLTGRLGIKPNPEASITDAFDFNIRVKDTKDLTKLIAPDLDTLKEITLRGRVDEKKGFSEFKLDAPSVRYGDFHFRFVDFNWNSVRHNAKFEFMLPQTEIGQNRKLSQIQLIGSSLNDELNFSIKAQDTAFIIRGIDLNGTLSVVDSLWNLRFNTSNIELFNESWRMEEGNYLRFGTNFFAANRFELMNPVENQRITFSEYNNNQGMLVTTTNLNLSYLNRFFKDSSLYFSGNVYDLDCRIDNLAGMEGIHLSVNTDTVFVNGRKYGILQGDFDQEKNGEPFLGKLFLRQPGSLLRINAAWVPENASPFSDQELGKVKPGEFQCAVSASDFPLAVLELFVPGISNTSGALQLNALAGGTFDQPGLKGNVFVQDGGFVIDYLKTRFHLQGTSIDLTHNRIWLERGNILDATKTNAATLTGGLRHNRFSDWEIACRIQSENEKFLVMNTSKTDNDVFYGVARGQFIANFTGTFESPNINITAANGPDTRLFIPLSSTSEVQQVSFVRFKTKTTDPDDLPLPIKRQARTLTGVDFELNITVNDQAEVQLIFDEQTGDIIRGRGNGGLKIKMGRDGAFNMYGDYVIEQGNYLFTLLNLVNKPFKVLKGGKIQWAGNPYEAEINLEANYSTSAPVFNLLKNELGLSQDEELIREAQKATQVDVNMHLTGKLSKPNIAFSMTFPRINTRLRTLADNKLLILSKDQNELTRQVFGMIVLGTFLPDDNALGQSADYVTTAFNTLSQVLTNQLSNYLTGLASEWFGGAVSSIDLDIMYNEYRNEILSGGTPAAGIGRELQLRLSSGFAEDRVIIQIGSQFGANNTPGTTIQQGFLGQDISVEIALTQNKQWRLRVYQRTEPDITGGQWRNRFGFGVTFRKEYDSFLDMVEGMNERLRKRS